LIVVEGEERLFICLRVQKLSFPSTTMSSTRPIVFMDINIGETPAGRLKMELFSDIVPKCAPKSTFQSGKTAHALLCL
jgi:hypothetical protein